MNYSTPSFRVFLILHNFSVWNTTFFRLYDLLKYIHFTLGWMKKVSILTSFRHSRYMPDIVGVQECSYILISIYNMPLWLSMDSYILEKPQLVEIVLITLLFRKSRFAGPIHIQLECICVHTGKTDLIIRCTCALLI